MKRVLITGLSGTGKSTVIAELSVRGYKAVDADEPEWSQWLDLEEDETVEPGRDWVWQEDLMQRLLTIEDTELLFVSGCAMNQVKFYRYFDHVILLTVPSDVILNRLAARSNNDYGKHPDEAARVLRLKETIEPKLRSAANFEIDASAPLDHVVETVLRLTN